jgi:hypothetical protein
MLFAFERIAYLQGSFFIGHGKYSINWRVDMAVTRIKNNQITDASAGNTQVGVNAAVKLQNYTVTATKIANNLVYGSDLTVTGNLTVQGNTTTIDTTITTIEDPVIVLASTQTSGTPTVDIGFLGYRGNQSNIAFVWNESADEFVTAFTSTGETNTTVTITSYANFHTNDANIGGNIVINGTTSLVGNVTGAVSFTSNVTAGNLLTSGVVSAAGNVTTAGAVSATGNVTGGNVNTAGAVSATGNVTGGNLLFGSGIVSGTGNVYASNFIGNISGNIDAAGSNTQVQFNDNDLLGASANFTFASNTNTLTVSNGNIVGGNLLTSGLVSATGTITSDNTITGGNVQTGGFLSATGNVTGGNVATAGTVSATGNVTGGNVATAGTVSATGTGTFGNIATAGTVSATGNVTGGNILFGSGIVSGTGNIYGGNIIADDGFFGNIDLTGDITVNSLTSNTFVSATGNITGGNIRAEGLLSASGTIRGNANIDAVGNINANNVNALNGDIIGNIIVSGSGEFGILPGQTVLSLSNARAETVYIGAGLANLLYIGNSQSNTNFGGNIIVNGFASATGNVTGGNLLTGGVISATGGITSAGNITGGNLLTGGLISAAGLATSGNVETAGYVSAAGNVIADNVNTDNVVSTGAITISTGANGNINLSTNGTGNIVLNNTYINGLQLTPQQDADAASKYYVDQLVTTAISYHEAVVAATNTTLATATGGTITYNQPNGAGNGVGATLTTTGAFNLIDTANVQTVGTRILVKDEGNAVFNGVYVWSNATVITRASTEDSYGAATANALSINDYFFVTGGNVNLGSAWIVDAPAGVITFGTSNIVFAQFSQAQVYSANTSAGLVLVGQTFSAKVDNNTTAFDGGGNIIVKAGANLTTPNIGAATGSSFSATGNIATGGNLVTAGYVTATGNVIAGSGSFFIGNGSQLTGVAAASVDANALTGNTLSSNILFSSLTSVGTLTSLSVSGNTVSGNIDTAGQITATGNITGGNVRTAGLISATGDITGGNISTAGTLSAIGNVNGGNLLTTGLISATSTITATDSITGGNLVTGGLVTASGNVTGGNLITGGFVTATGNVTGGNVNTAGTVTATGNITGGNVLTGGLITATGAVTAGGFTTTGNVTGGNLLFGSGIVSGTGNIYADTIFANISGNIDAGGANTEIQFNNDNVLAGSPGFTFNTVGNVVTANGNILSGGIVSAVGNVYAPGIQNGGTGLILDPGFPGFVQFFNGNGSTVRIDDSGNILANAAVSAVGNVTGGNILTGGLISATGNATAGNVNTAGLITATGNIYGGNLILAGAALDTTAGRLTVNSTSSDADFAVNGDTLANVFYVDAGTGTASFGSSAQTTNAIVAFNASNSVKMPVGNTAQRPSTGVTGMLRFNTTDNNLEIYNNTEWEAVGVPAFTVIDDQQFNGDGSTVAFTLSTSQTTNSCIVSINGVIQIPTLAYSVSTTTLTFTEAPAAGDVIDVRQITTTTTVTGLSNSSGNAEISASETSASFDVKGNLIPTSDNTFTLGNASNRWANLFVSGNSIYLGNLILKENPANVFVVYLSDGITQANIDVGNVDVSAITTGTSTIGIYGTGQAYVSVNGNSNVLLISNTSALVNGAFSATGNITGNYIFGNGSQLTGIDATSIQSGTSNVRVVSSGGNVATGVGGTSNVVVVSTAGQFVTGVVSATGNITGNYFVGNGSQLTGIDATAIQNGTANVRTFLNGNVTTSAGGTANVLNVTSTGALVTGLISATGNITGNYFIGNGSQLTGIDATSIQNGTSNVRVLSTNGNVAVNVNGNGIVSFVADGIINNMGNGVGNIGNSSGYFNTIFAKATSAQYADLAEKYTADAEYEPGTVVMFGGEAEVTICGADMCKRVAGVVSTNPSYIMNGTLESEHVATVALTGRVPCRVTGTVRKGDLMVSAGNGTARAEENPSVGTVIGKALADFDGTEGVIEVVVGRF